MSIEWRPTRFLPNFQLERKQPVNRYKLVAGLALVASVVGAHAISFSGVNADVNHTWGTIGADGLYIQVPSHTLFGVGNKVVNFSYNVSATPGFLLNKVRFVPNGAVGFGGASKITTFHGAISQTAITSAVGAPIQIFSASFGLAPAASYVVTGSMTLTGTQANSLAKISVGQFFYEEQPVPEPATLAALGLGAAAMLRRKGGRK